MLAYCNPWGAALYMRSSASHCACVSMQHPWTVNSGGDHLNPLYYLSSACVNFLRVVHGLQYRCSSCFWKLLLYAGLLRESIRTGREEDSSVDSGLCCMHQVFQCMANDKQQRLAMANDVSTVMDWALVRQHTKYLSLRSFAEEAGGIVCGKDEFRRTTMTLTWERAWKVRCGADNY